MRERTRGLLFGFVMVLVGLGIAHFNDDHFNDRDKFEKGRIAGRAEMKRWQDDYYAAHPVVKEAPETEPYTHWDFEQSENCLFSGQRTTVTCTLPLPVEDSSIIIAVFKWKDHREGIVAGPDPQPSKARKPRHAIQMDLDRGVFTGRDAPPWMSWSDEQWLQFQFEHPPYPCDGKPPRQVDGVYIPCVNAPKPNEQRKVNLPREQCLMVGATWVIKEQRGSGGAYCETEQPENLFQSEPWDCGDGRLTTSPCPAAKPKPIGCEGIFLEGYGDQVHWAKF